MQRVPSAAPATCLMQTSNPTVAFPSSSSGWTSIAEHPSIIEIIPGVESTENPSVPPTSVSSRPSTTNSTEDSIPGSRRMTADPTACIDSAAMPPSPVSIVGATGALGFGLALRLGQRGVPIVIGSRDEGRAQEAAARAAELVSEGSFSGAVNADAVQDTPIVILSVPFRNQSENLTNLKGALKEGQLLVDATVPLAAAFGGKATRTLGVWQGSAAQQAQEMVPPGVHVVSAFHTVSAKHLSELEYELDEDVLICGDRGEDKAKITELVELIPGLRPVDCGPLEMARIVEQLTALMISINVRNKVSAGIRITGLPR